MSKLISGYLWAFRNYKSGALAIGTLKTFYPDADLFVNVDEEGEHEGYKAICEAMGATYSKNNFQLGYCGEFKDSIKVGRTHWPKEYTFEWVRGIYEACKKTDSKYMMLMEEDDFVLRHISILERDFSMAIHPTNPSPIGRSRPNSIPTHFRNFITDNGGKTANVGYAAGGGTIFNREQFIQSWENKKDLIWENYHNLERVSKIIGWADYILQFIMQLGGYDIIQNHQLCEHWELGDRWTEFEIVTGMKDDDAVRQFLREKYS